MYIDVKPTELNSKVKLFLYDAEINLGKIELCTSTINKVTTLAILIIEKNIIEQTKL